MFHTYFIHELYIAANVFLVELNWVLKKSFKMNDIILYGGSILSVLTGTGINDYDITLKSKLSPTEMLDLVTAFAARYQVFIDNIENPKKMLVLINERWFDFNNLANLHEINFSTFEQFFPQHVYVEFNRFGVEKVVCSELANIHLKTGTINISNLFDSKDNSKIKNMVAKYLTKGFVPAGECENDSELAFKVIDHLTKTKSQMNKLNRVVIEDNKIKFNEDYVVKKIFS